MTISLNTGIADIPSLITATIPERTQQMLFGISLVVASILTFYLIYHKSERFRNFIQTIFRTNSRNGSEFKREARLHKVICHHCNKGMGLYDPVYLQIKGESFIEGTCTQCGTFVRAKLR